MIMERLSAWVMGRAGGYLERELADTKRTWLAPLRGRVLELGPGLGTNLPYLSHADWTGLEPNAAMRAALGKMTLPGPVLAAPAEAIPCPEAAFDHVVCTLVLCSVQDPRQALREILRVLKPGGTFVYLEHVAAGALGTRLLQHSLRPLCGLMGCHPVRATGRLIAQAGFAQVEQEAVEVRGMALLPHIVGRARRHLR